MDGWIKLILIIINSNLAERFLFLILILFVDVCKSVYESGKNGMDSK